MNFLEKALYTTGGLLAGAVLAFNVACSSPSPMPTQIPSATHAPLSSSTPAPIATAKPTLTPTPTTVKKFIREENLDRLINDLYVYKNIDKRDELVARINIIRDSKLPTLAQAISINAFSNSFQNYAGELRKLLSEYDEMEKLLGIFGKVDNFPQQNNWNYGMPVKVSESGRTNIANKLKKVEASIELAQRYGDRSLIDIDTIGSIRKDLVFNSLTHTYTMHNAWGNYLTPVAKILIDYFNREFNVGISEFRFQLKSDNILIDLHGVDNGDSYVLIPNPKGGHPFYPELTNTIQAPVNSNVDLIGAFTSPRFDYNIFQFDNSDSTNNEWISYISTQKIKRDGEDCIRFEICLDKVFWPHGDGNYYAYGKAIGRYILIIGPSKTIWDKWDGNQISKTKNFMSYLTK